MKTLAALSLGALLTMAISASPPLSHIATDSMPTSVTGRFDHLEADPAGNRLFLAAESAHEVLIFNLRTGAYERALGGIGIPHAIFVRDDLHRVYITDGGTGALRIYDGRSYKLLQTVPLKVDADSIGYDPGSHDLYIDNGGGDAHEAFSMFSAVNTETGAKDWEIQIPGDTLEAMAVARTQPLVYVNNRARNQVAVVNRGTHAVVASWPITKSKVNVAMALDEAHHRLFVGCREGAIVVLDTASGRELQALPIPTGADDLRFDGSNQRIYAATGSGNGEVTVYQEATPDRYTALGAVASGPGGKNETLAAGRLYVTIPPAKATPGRVLVFRAQ